MTCPRAQVYRWGSTTALRAPRLFYHLEVRAKDEPSEWGTRACAGWMALGVPCSSLSGLRGSRVYCPWNSVRKGPASGLVLKREEEEEEILSVVSRDGEKMWGAKVPDLPEKGAGKSREQVKELSWRE